MRHSGLDEAAEGTERRGKMTELKRKMTELKPCPFCGGEKLVITSCAELEICNNFEKCERTHYYTVCCDFNQGGCGASSGYRPSKEEAIEAWSRRAGE